MPASALDDEGVVTMTPRGSEYGGFRRFRTVGAGSTRHRLPVIARADRGTEIPTRRYGKPQRGVRIGRIARARRCANRADAMPAASRLAGPSRNPWLAIDAATPPARRARELRSAWERFVSGDPVRAV